MWICGRAYIPDALVVVRSIRGGHHEFVLVGKIQLPSRKSLHSGIRMTNMAVRRRRTFGIYGLEQGRFAEQVNVEAGWVVGVGGGEVY